MGINAGGINKNQTTTTKLTVINGATIDSTTLVVDDVNNLVKIGDNLSLNTDSSVINMGVGNDVAMTHDGTTGVTIAANPITIDSAGALNLYGTSINVGTDTDVAIDIDSSTLDIDASGMVTLNSSGGPIAIGDEDQDQAINIATGGTRVVTVGVDNNGADATTVKINSGDVKIHNTSQGNGTFPKLTLQTGDTDIAANNILGQIDFQAPDHTEGTDSILVAASIVAISEGDFSTSNNATSLQLRTGASEVATTKLTIDSAGLATFAGSVDITGGLSFDEGTAVTSIDTDLTSVAGTHTTLASANAIKTYIDTSVTAQDLDATTDSGTIDIDLDSETLTIAGGTGATTAGSGTTITINVDASQGQITTVGALNAGSITSGFTSIDVGAGAISTTGAVSTGDITVAGGDIAYSNAQVATLAVTTSGSGTVGRDLTISAGSTTAASGNTDGGDLILKSGFADGTGSSFIGLHTATSASDNAVAERMRVHTDGNVGIGDATPGTLLQLSGADAYLTLKNTTAENGDGGAETKILFEDHANAALGQVEVHHNGSSDDTKGQMILSSHDGSSLVSGIEITEGVVTKLSVAADTVAQASDHILFFDGGAGGAPKVESIDHFLTAIAGSGISVSSSQLTASGVTALNGLSDVSYGSGDLVITSLDTLTTSLPLHDAAGTAVVIRSGSATEGTSDDQAGGSLTLQGGQGKGTGVGGDIIFQTAKSAGSSADTYNALATRVTINQKGEMLFGASQDGTIGLSDTGTDAAGKGLKIKGGQPTAGTDSDIAGGAITLLGGAGKGTGAGGEIIFQVVPATGSGHSVNSTAQTQMTISQTGVVVNDAGNEACNFRVQGEDWPNLLNVDAGLNQVGIGHDESDPGSPAATLYVRNKNDNAGGNVPLVLLSNDNVDVICLDINASNTTANVITVNADSMTTATAFFMSVDGLETGKAVEIICNRGHAGIKTLIHAENQHNSAINTTLLHLKNSANQNVAPHALLEYAGDQVDHPVILELRRSDTGSDADGMDLGVINFTGTDNGDNLLTYAQIFSEAETFADGSQDGAIEFKTQIAETLTTQLKINSSGVHFPAGLTQGDAVAASSNQSSGNGNVTSNNYKISHTLTLNANLTNGSGITEFTVTSDKVLAASVVIASSNLLDISSPREVVVGSFKISGKNKTGGTLDDGSTVVINYIIL